MPGGRFEPAPLAFLSRQSFHPWLVVGVTCIGAFIGQVDASIVQLALPTLQVTFKATVSEVREQVPPAARTARATVWTASRSIAEKRVVVGWSSTSRA